eukprot:5010558-Karenia_brevis.AAC.1
MVAVTVKGLMSELLPQLLKTQQEIKRTVDGDKKVLAGLTANLLKRSAKFWLEKIKEGFQQIGIQLVMN